MLFLKNLLLRNFQGCCLLFNYQGSLLFLFSRSNSDILSCCFLFVKNFFVLFFCDSFQTFACFESALIYYHNHLHLSTTFLFCFASFSKQFVVTRLRQLVNNTKPSFVCQQLFSSFYFMNVRITCPDSLPIHLNIDVRRRYFPRGEYYTNIIFFYCQHTFFIFYTYILLKFLL